MGGIFCGVRHLFCAGKVESRECRDDVASRCRDFGFCAAVCRGSPAREGCESSERLVKGPCCRQRLEVVACDVCPDGEDALSRASDFSNGRSVCRSAESVDVLVVELQPSVVGPDVDVAAALRTYGECYGVVVADACECRVDDDVQFSVLRVGSRSHFERSRGIAPQFDGLHALCGINRHGDHVLLVEKAVCRQFYLNFRPFLHPKLYGAAILCGSGGYLVGDESAQGIVFGRGEGTVDVEFVLLVVSGGSHDNPPRTLHVVRHAVEG